VDLLTGWRVLKTVRVWLVVAVVVGVVAGALWPTRHVHGRPATIQQALSGDWGRYAATVVVGVPPGSDAAGRADQAAFYAQSQAVVDGTLAILNQPDGGALLTRALTLRTRADLGQLVATASGASPDQAAAIANAFATALQNRLATIAQESAAARLRTAKQYVDLLQSQIDELNGQVAALPAGGSQGVEVRARLSATSSAYTAAYSNYTLAQNAAANGTQALLVTLQPATAAQATYVAARPTLVDQRWVRALAVGLFALLLVAAGRLLWELRRPRLRTRRQAELAFSAPVIAELPRLRRHTTDVAVRVAPFSRSAEAYRQIRTVVLPTRPAAVLDHRPDVWEPWPTPAELVLAQAAEGGSSEASAFSGGAARRRAGGKHASPDSSGQVIMLVRTNTETSLPAVTANLAAAVAETGRSVAVLRADAGAEIPASLFDEPVPLRRTDLLHVSELAFDPRRADTVTLVTLVSSAAARADVVLLVGGSVLGESSAAALGPMADSVILIGEMGVTTVSDAQSAAQALRRLDLPLQGVVLGAMPESDLIVRPSTQPEAVAPGAAPAHRPAYVDLDAPRSPVHPAGFDDIPDLAAHIVAAGVPDDVPTQWAPRASDGPPRTLVRHDDLPEAPAAETLHRRSLRPAAALTDLWQSRGLVRTLAERDLRVRYKQAVLGLAWALVTPLAMLVAFVVVFDRAAKVDTQGVPYALFAFVGLVPWAFFAAVVGSAGNSVLADKGLLSKSYFPREVFPLAATATALCDAVAGLVPLAVLFGIHRRGIGLNAVYTPLPLLVLLVFAVGVGLFASAVIVYLRDVRFVLPLVLQVGLFLTPIGYAMTLVPEQWQLAYSFVDPVAPVVDTLRRCLLLDAAPHWSQLGAAAATAVVVLVGGWLTFKRLEPGFADVA
jgi:ABC-2 type transport system permease protein/lipopolysaccharide transport system permease protein